MLNFCGFLCLTLSPNYNVPLTFGFYSIYMYIYMTVTVSTRLHLLAHSTLVRFKTGVDPAIKILVTVTLAILQQKKPHSKLVEKSF